MFSLAVTAWRETTRDDCRRIIRCVEEAAKAESVRTIMVIDDASDDFATLCNLLAAFESKKGLESRPLLSLVRNSENLGVLANKIKSVEAASLPWVQLCDSDNTMGESYWSRVPSLLSTDTWYCASFARPAFDYRDMVGEWSLANFDQLLRFPLHACFLNTGNQLVHRETFLRTFQDYRRPRPDLAQPDYLNIGDRSDLKWRLVYDALDSFFLNKTWLLAGGKLCIVPGLEYDHHYSSGPDSNYARAPEEKHKISPFYFAELAAAKDRLCPS